MAHKSHRITALRSLLSKFRRDRLQLFEKSIAGTITRHSLRTIVDYIYLARYCPVVKPGAYVFGRIRCDLVKTSFSKTPSLSPSNGAVVLAYNEEQMASLSVFDRPQPTLLGRQWRRPLADPLPNLGCGMYRLQGAA